MNKNDNNYRRVPPGSVNRPQSGSNHVSPGSVNRPQGGSNRMQYENGGYDVQREMLLRRRAEKEKRQRMLRRNRIISRVVLALLAGVVIFFVVKAFLTKSKPKAPPSSSAASVSTPAIVSSSVPPISTPPPEAAPTGSNIGDWNMLLVNANMPLPEGYVPEVVKVDIAGHEFDARAAEALKKMIAEGNATGLELLITSAYRSTERQTTLFNEMKADYISKGKTEEEAYDITKTIRAIPGTSEHETGLAADIVSVKAQVLEDSFENTPEFAWLSENAANYGFILRYPREKQTITGIIYEPWHYRYVGVDAAKDIKSKKMCLEEYLETIKQ